MEEKEAVTVGDLFSKGAPSQNLQPTHRYSPIKKEIVPIESDEGEKS